MVAVEAVQVVGMLTVDVAAVKGRTLASRLRMPQGTSAPAA